MASVSVQRPSVSDGVVTRVTGRFEFCNNDHMLNGKPNKPMEEAIMARIPLVSSHWSTANSTFPAIIDSTRLLNTFLSCRTALAMRLRLRCCSLSLAKYCEKE